MVLMQDRDKVVATRLVADTVVWGLVAVFVVKGLEDECVFCWCVSFRPKVAEV